jgi:hypothetical protein
MGIVDSYCGRGGIWHLAGHHQKRRERVISIPLPELYALEHESLDGLLEEQNVVFVSEQS